VDAARVALDVEQRQTSNPDPAPTMRSADEHETALVRAEEQMAGGEPVQIADVVRSQPAYESLESFMARSKIKPEAEPREITGDFFGWLRSVGGVDIGQKFDITGDRNNVRNNPGGIFRNGGNPTDVLVDMAEQAGYLRPGADSGAFVELVQRAVRGEPVLNFDQQMAAASRLAAIDDMAARLQDVQARLALLGIDTAAANGNLAALEAYAKANEPRILAAALDEVRAASETGPEYEALQVRARQIAADMADGGRTLAQYEADVQPLSPVMRQMVARELDQKPTAATPEPPTGNARDLRAEVIALRKSESVLRKLMECMA
jgi:hypothetical protein